MRRPRWEPDKASTIECDGALSAYGIELSTRWSKASEMIRLIALARAFANTGTDAFVERINFDSKSCTWTVRLRRLDEPGPVADQIVKEEEVFEHLDSYFLFVDQYGQSLVCGKGQPAAG